VLVGAQEGVLRAVERNVRVAQEREKKVVDRSFVLVHQSNELTLAPGLGLRHRPDLQRET
jgi:hypothetical protein